MKKFILIFLAILISIKLIMLLGFTESELVIAGIIFAFYLLIEKIEEELAVLDFNPQRALDMLGHMGIGMLVIFVIIGVIVLSTVAIQKISSGKKDK